MLTLLMKAQKLGPLVGILDQKFNPDHYEEARFLGHDTNYFPNFLYFSTVVQ